MLLPPTVGDKPSCLGIRRALQHLNLLTGSARQNVRAIPELAGEPPKPLARVHVLPPRPLVAQLREGAREASWDPVLPTIE